MHDGGAPIIPAQRTGGNAEGHIYGSSTWPWGTSAPPGIAPTLNMPMQGLFSKRVKRHELELFINPPLRVLSEYTLSEASRSIPDTVKHRTATSKPVLAEREYQRVTSKHPLCAP